MINLNFFILIIFGYFIASLIIPGLLKFLVQANMTAVNFRNEEIPRGGGLIFSGSILLSGLIFQFLIGDISFQLLYLLIGIIATTLLGTIDDLAGDKSTQGIKGHLGQLLKGNLTTGGLKAVGGGLIALFLVIPFSQNILLIFLNTLLVALSINMINLLDLRPGRAVKGILFGILIILLAGNIQNLLWVGLVIGIMLAYLPLDLHARVMLGDSGSNSLGVILGMALVWGLPLQGKIAGLLFLLIVHIYAEFKSISKLIEQTPFLNLLDRLGR